MLMLFQLTSAIKAGIIVQASQWSGITTKVTHLSEAFHTMGESVCESAGESVREGEREIANFGMVQRLEQGVDLTLAVMCPFELIGAVSA